MDHVQDFGNQPDEVPSDEENPLVSENSENSDQSDTSSEDSEDQGIGTDTDYLRECVHQLNINKVNLELQLSASKRSLLNNIKDWFRTRVLSKPMPARGEYFATDYETFP